MTVRNTIGVVGRAGTDDAPIAIPITTTTDTRLVLGVLARRVSGVRPRTGVLHGPAGANLQVTGTNGWGYSVEPGGAIIGPDAAAGAYIVPSDSQTLVPTIPKPGTGSRVDIIYIAQHDAWDRTADATEAVLGVLSGAASTGVPVPPTLPDGALELARNTIVSGATTTLSEGNSITNTAPFTAVAGGVVYYRGQADQNADTGANDGDLSYRADADVLQVYVAGEHQALALATGAAPLVPSASARDALFAALGGPQQGQRCTRTDMNWVERYYTTWNALSNPGGATPAGWYPDGGKVPKMRLAKTDAMTLLANNYQEVGWSVDTYKHAISHDPTLGMPGVPVTIPVTGRYRFNMRLSLIGAGTLTVQLTKNTAELGRFTTDATGTAANYSKVTIDGTEQFNAGDVLRVRVRASVATSLESSQCYWDLAYDAAPV